MTRARADAVLLTAGPLFHPRSHHLLARALADAGLVVVEIGQPHPRGRQTTPVATVAVRIRGSRARRMTGAPLALLRAFRLRPRLLQVNSIELLPWSVVARVLTQVPTIYDSREDYAAFMLIKSWLPARLRPVVSWIVGRAEPWLARHLDAVITADTATAEKFRTHTPVITVHNFPRRETVAFEASKDPEYDVTYHGTVSSDHLDRIVATASALRDTGRDVRWCIAALEPSSADWARIERRLREAGLAQSFTLLHDLPHPQIPTLVRTTRIGFIPLPDEIKFHHNIPMKLFEFLAAGKPVVVSDLPPIRRLVGGRDCCILVRPDDIAAYAEAIRALLADPVRAAEMGERGRTLILDEFNAERELEAYVGLCKRLLAGQNA